MEGMTDIDCLMTSPEPYMKQMLIISLSCIVSITICNGVTDRTQILLFRSRSNVPTMTSKMQVVCILSVSCNIKDPAQEQRQHKIPWSTLRNWTFRHSRWANMAIQQTDPYDHVIIQVKASAAWRQKLSVPQESCAACDIKTSSQLRQD